MRRAIAFQPTSRCPVRDGEGRRAATLSIESPSWPTQSKIYASLFSDEARDAARAKLASRHETASAGSDARGGRRDPAACRTRTVGSSASVMMAVASARARGSRSVVGAHRLT